MSLQKHWWESILLFPIAFLHHVFRLIQYLRHQPQTMLPLAAITLTALIIFGPVVTYASLHPGTKDS